VIAKFVKGGGALKQENKELIRKTKIIITIITLTILIISATPLIQNTTITPLTTQTTQPTQKDVTGQGANTQATLIITGNTTTGITGDTQSGFNTPCPQGWGILNTTLTITNITAPNAIIKQGERLSPNIGARLILGNLFQAAMSFKLSTQTARLINVSLHIEVQRSGNLTILVYNATKNESNNMPMLDYSLFTSAGLPVSKGRQWFNYTLPSPLTLDSSNTFEGTFFIVVYGAGSLSAYWTFISDEEGFNDGYAYTTTFLDPVWTYEDIDFKMRVVVDPGPVYPSEIGLSFNRTDVGSFVVEDVPGQRGNGTCTIVGPTSPSQNGWLSFNASANWEGTVSFNVSEANSTLYRKMDATTVYAATPDEIRWNVTVDVTDGFPEVGMGKFINVSIPVDWWNMTGEALNVSGGNVISASPYLRSDSGVLLFEATNGTWIVQCRGPNVLSSFSVYSLYKDFNPVNVSGAVVGDDLSVRGVLDAALSGTANLTVLKDGVQVFMNSTGFSGSSVEVGWSNVGVEPGSYTLRLLVECGLEVGLLERSFTVSARAPCSIRVDRIESTDKVRMLLYVSRSDTGFPVAGASIAIYHDGSQIQLEQVEDYENGSYFVVFTPPGEGAYAFRVEVSGERIDTASTTVEVGYAPPPLSPAMVSSVLVLVAQSVQSAQRSHLMAATGVLAAVVATAGTIGARTYRKLRAPVKALAAMENLLVTHKDTGLPLWSFNILSLDVDVTLVSGLVSAVRSFSEEMRVGGFNVLETRLGTFVRAESELLEVVCIMKRVGRFEVEWLRGRLSELLRLVEAEAGEALRKWEGGEVAEFREVFRRAFSSVFDYPKLLRLHEARMRKLVAEKSRLIEALVGVEKEAAETGKLFEQGALSAEEYERRTSELSREKEILEQKLVGVDETLSRLRVRELIITGKVDEIRERFNTIRGEIEELRKKEEKGELTDKERKKLRALEKELRKLVDELSKIEEAGGS